MPIHLFCTLNLITIYVCQPASNCVYGHSKTEPSRLWCFSIDAIEAGNNWESLRFDSSNLAIVVKLQSRIRIELPELQTNSRFRMVTLNYRSVQALDKQPRGFMSGTIVVFRLKKGRGVKEPSPSLSLVLQSSNTLGRRVSITQIHRVHTASLPLCHCSTHCWLVVFRRSWYVEFAILASPSSRFATGRKEIIVTYICGALAS